MIHFKCTKCGQDMEAPEELRGKALKCPRCGLHETVPKSNKAHKKVLSIVFVILIFITAIIITGYFSYQQGKKKGQWESYISGMYSAFLYDEIHKKKENPDEEQYMPQVQNNYNIYVNDFVISGGFTCRNLLLRPDYSKKICDVIGEMTNNSGKSYTMANFIISVYDQQDVLIDIGYIMIGNFNNGQTKSFALLSGLDKIATTIHYCKINFESGI